MFLMCESVKVSNVFNTSTLIKIFWKTKTFFKKLENHFLVENTEIKNTPFSFKTPLSAANVKTNRMATTKWTYHKEWSFASNCFIILENLFQFQHLLKRVNLNDPSTHICIFRKHWSLTLASFFPVSILKYTQSISCSTRSNIITESQLTTLRSF